MTSFGNFAPPYQKAKDASTQKEGGVPLTKATVQNLPDDSPGRTGKTGCPPRIAAGMKTGKRKTERPGTSTAAPAGPPRKARNPFLTWKPETKPPRRHRAGSPSRNRKASTCGRLNTPGSDTASPKENRQNPQNTGRHIHGPTASAPRRRDIAQPKARDTLSPTPTKALHPPVNVVSKQRFPGG